jgi:hypothetical protein
VGANQLPVSAGLDGAFLLPVGYVGQPALAFAVQLHDQDDDYEAIERVAADWLEGICDPFRARLGLAPEEMVSVRAVVDGLAAAVSGGAAGVGLSSSHISACDWRSAEGIGPDDPAVRARNERARLWARDTRGVRAHPGDLARRDAVGVPVVRYAVGGEYLRLSYEGASACVPEGVLRGRVTEFTPASRGRLFDFLQCVDREAVIAENGLPLFMTLTYPREWSPDCRRWKSDLDNFLYRLERRYPGVAAVWRLEFQKRGAPHFHLLVFYVRSVPWRWLRGAWAQVVAGCRSCRWDEESARWISGPKCMCDQRHVRAGTQVKRVQSWHGVMRYASKTVGALPVAGEMSKVRQAHGVDPETGELLNVGRWWGKHHGDRLPVLMVTAEIVAAAAPAFKRALVGWKRRQGKKVPMGGRYRGARAFVSYEVGERMVDWIMASFTESPEAARVRRLRERLALHQQDQGRGPDYAWFWRDVDMDHGAQLVAVAAWWWSVQLVMWLDPYMALQYILRGLVVPV